MKAFVVTIYGGKDVLEAQEVAIPSVGDIDVLVQIKAASVNPVDYRIRNGEFKQIIRHKLPFILGSDFAGIVTEVGAKVTRFKPGDEVYGLPEQERIGSFAEYVVVNQSVLATKPKNLSMEEAASIPLVSLTAWQALVEIAGLKKGQKVFIQAGSGGVGTIAIQLAKHLGATVATTVSQKNSALAKSLGVDVVIDYKKDDFETILNGYDVVLNSQDGKTLEKSLRILKPGGKLISISGPPTPKFAGDQGLPSIFKLIMMILSSRTRRQAKKLGVNYSFLLMHPDGQQLQSITSLVESGIIKPVIDSVYPFSQTKDAIAYVESGRTKGKVVIKV